MDGSLLVWIYGFQSLIAGALALIGALLTVWFIRKQIQQSEKERDDLLERKSRAARAHLAFALKAVSDYSIDLGKLAAWVFQQRGQEVVGILEIPAPPAIPEIPANVVGVLKEAVEYAEDGWGGPIADLMSDLQVSQSRAESAIAGLKHYPSFERLSESLFDDAKMLHGKTDRLFAYARGEMEDTAELEPVKTESFKRKVGLS